MKFIYCKHCGRRFAVSDSGDVSRAERDALCGVCSVLARIEA